MISSWRASSSARPDVQASWGRKSAALAAEYGKEESFFRQKQKLTKLMESDGWSASGGSRGIVTCAGGQTYVLNLLVMLRLLRTHLKCTLPVQIFYWGADDIDPATAHFLATNPNLGIVEVIDASTYPVPSHRRVPPDESMRGFPLKPFALLMSSFTEVCVRAWCRGVVRDLFSSPALPSSDPLPRRRQHAGG